MNTYTKLQNVKEHIRGMGVQPAVIDCVDILCDIIWELTDDVQLLMSRVQNHISASDSLDPVQSSVVPITENKGSVEGSEADETTQPTKPVEDTQMSNDEKPIAVDSSIESAVEAIKKEKKKKKETLENIFSDNKTGRYSGPIDS
jgi:hypothetical protein